VREWPALAEPVCRFARFRQDAAQKGSLLVEPAQAALFEQAETALRYQQVPAIQRVDQRADRIVAQDVEAEIVQSICDGSPPPTLSKLRGNCSC